MEDRKQIKSTVKSILEVVYNYVYTARGIDDLKDEEDIEDFHRALEDALFEGCHRQPGCQESELLSMQSDGLQLGQPALTHPGPAKRCQHDLELPASTVIVANAYEAPDKP